MAPSGRVQPRQIEERVSPSKRQSSKVVELAGATRAMVVAALPTTHEVGDAGCGCVQRRSGVHLMLGSLAQSSWSQIVTPSNSLACCFCFDLYIEFSRFGRC